LGPDESPLLGVQGHGGDAGLIERGEKLRLLVVPLVGISPPRGDEPRHRAPRHQASGLHEHLQVVAVGEAPENLTHFVAGKRGEGPPEAGLDVDGTHGGNLSSRLAKLRRNSRTFESVHDGCGQDSQGGEGDVYHHHICRITRLFRAGTLQLLIR
jgi:hypothetical protein